MAWVIFGLIGLILLGIWLYVVITAPKKDSTYPTERIEQAQTRTSVDMNRFAAGAEQKRSEARTGLNTQLNTESLTYIEMVNQQTAAKLAEYENLMAVDRKRREDIMLQAMQMNQLLVLHAANEYRLSTQAYEQMMIESVKLGQQMMLTQNNQSLEIQKHFQMKLIEHQMEELTAGLKKEMLQYKNLLPYHQYDQLNNMLSIANGNLDLYKRTQFPSVELKERELKRMENYIKTLKGKINEWKKHRLV